MNQLQGTPTTDSQYNDDFVRLFQDLSAHGQPNRHMYIPADDFTCICFTWLSLKGHEINYPKEKGA